MSQKPQRRQEDGILGNGTLTFAARVSAVLALICLPIAGTGLTMFGQHWLDQNRIEQQQTRAELQKINDTLVDILTYIAGAQARDAAQEARGVENRRRLDRIEGKVFQ